MRIALALFLISTSCLATQTKIRVLDGSGAPVKDVLVIVEALNSSYQDVSRQSAARAARTCLGLIGWGRGILRDCGCGGAECEQAAEGEGEKSVAHGVFILRFQSQEPAG